MLIESVDALPALVGTKLPPSAWIDVTQARVDAFAAATDDAQWIHCDPEHAKASPYGSTIAHGFLTLSLIPSLWRDVVTIGNLRMTVNLGLERLRFPAPLPIPSRIRAHFTITAATRQPDYVRTLISTTVERENADEPVCVASLILLHYAVGSDGIHA